MTDCNCCGGCCDPVVLKYTERELRMALTGDAMSEEDRKFVLEHMHQLPAKEGLHRAAHFNGRFDRLARINTETGEVTTKQDPSVFYRCDYFDDDPTSRTYRMCTAHEKRPPLCRGFPFYGRDPEESSRFLPIDCAYRADQPNYGARVTLVRKEDRRV